MIPQNLSVDDLAILQRLISEDCEKFFDERQRLIDSLINACAQATRKERLQQLQAEIDNARAASGCPLAAAKTIVGMLEDYVLALEACVDQLQRNSNV